MKVLYFILMIVGTIVYFYGAVRYLLWGIKYSIEKRLSFGKDLLLSLPWIISGLGFAVIIYFIIKYAKSIF